MRISVIQHTPDTPPSFTTTWLEKNKMPYDLVKPFEGAKIPAASEIDWLIVLGGGMNVDDEKNFPFLKVEKKLVEQILKENKTYLGLCLGGQMLARVMGAQVKKHSDWEVGWHQVQIENKILGINKRPALEELFAFQWHQDTFDLPAGATLFAKNHITPNQGFIVDSGNAVATQFHPEADEAWVRSCAADDELPVARFAQTPQEMINGLKFLSTQSSWFSDLMAHLASITKVHEQISSITPRPQKNIAKKA